MKKVKSAMRWAALAGVAVVVLAGPARSARVHAPAGPHRVGFRVEQVQFEGRVMAMAVWYPALPGPSARPHHYAPGLTGAAVRDATPDPADAPYPMIIYSHGCITCGIQSLFYTENLASHGCLQGKL